MKKRGFGVGRWNGFGGKIDPGESPEDNARREIFEESGLTVTELDHVGFLEFDLSRQGLRVSAHVFRITSYQGEPRETEEMRPQWFIVDEIPFDDMWPDDRIWLPAFLKGQKFQGAFWLDENHQLIRHELKIIS